MKIKNTTIGLMVGMLLIPWIGYTADSSVDPSVDLKPDSPDPSIIVQDSGIANKIKVRLNADKHLGKFKSIQVEADNNGVVLLSGTVHLLSEEEKAVAIARSTEGVVIVKSNIKIKSGHSVNE
jgi:osmotically-inducible protein OsmY